MFTWLRRHASLVIGFSTLGTTLGIGLAAATESTWTAALISARQMYGLTALGVLVAASMIGPLVAILPPLPLCAYLVAARRAIGVSAFVLVVPHVVCYLVPVLLRSWREVLAPGAIWVTGLVLGFLAALDLAALAWTSRDTAVKALGGARWKRLHRTVYVALPVVVLHALGVGTDFGLNLASDVQGDADHGALIAFGVLTVTWVGLVWLRHWGVRWPRVHPPGPP